MRKSLSSTWSKKSFSVTRLSILLECVFFTIVIEAIVTVPYEETKCLSKLFLTRGAPSFTDWIHFNIVLGSLLAIEEKHRASTRSKLYSDFDDNRYAQQVCEKIHENIFIRFIKYFENKLLISRENSRMNFSRYISNYSGIELDPLKGVIFHGNQAHGTSPGWARNWAHCATRNVTNILIIYDHGVKRFCHQSWLRRLNGKSISRD